MGTFLVRVWSGSRCSEWLSHYGEELRGLCSLLRERRRASQIPILNAGKHSDPGKENLKPQHFPKCTLGRTSTHCSKQKLCPPSAGGAPLVQLVQAQLCNPLLLRFPSAKIKMERAAENIQSGAALIGHSQAGPCLPLAPLSALRARAEPQDDR